jgi:hypothetical protein
MPTEQSKLLSLPPGIGRAIVESAAVITRPLLRTDEFVDFCNKRSLRLSRDRLLRLERLRFFSPIFRVRTPNEDVEPLSIPPVAGNNWFDKGWAWDTAGVNVDYEVPDPADRTQEGYYSAFQIDYLEILLAEMTLHVHLDSYLEPREPIDWNKSAANWLESVKVRAPTIRGHEFRRALALLCQFISNRYFPKTQGNQRTIAVPSGHFSSDHWTVVRAHNWHWRTARRAVKPSAIQALFGLTPENLRHAYSTLALGQAHCDPLERWYQLVQFVNVAERAKLKDKALRAETLRSGALMLRMLHRDLFGEELPPPNEVAGQVITHIPELAVRKDVRKYLEFVANRYGVNPQPKLCLIVEGATEEKAVTAIFEQYFGAHPGNFSVEIIVLGGVDAATGTKEDRFRAILRLVDYLHHHQTITFLILDQEGYAKRLVIEANKAHSIHGPRGVTRPDYIKVWDQSFEFDNFTDGELARGLNEQAGQRVFSRRQLRACRREANAGAALKKLYASVTGAKLDKLSLGGGLVEQLLSTKPLHRISTRPLISTLERVAELAMRNPLPTMLDSWEKNQASSYFGVPRGQTKS